MTTARDNIISEIARTELDIETLDTRARDALDFHDLGVASIKAALERAYQAGRRAAPPTQVTCPACGRNIKIQSI